MSPPQLASKFFDDVYYNNAYYARVGGISNSEVNSLEMEMLRMISFSLFVQPDQYERYRGSLYSHVSPAPQLPGQLPPVPYGAASGSSSSACTCAQPLAAGGGSGSGGTAAASAACSCGGGMEAATCGSGGAPASGAPMSIAMGSGGAGALFNPAMYPAPSYSSAAADAMAAAAANLAGGVAAPSPHSALPLVTPCGAPTGAVGGLPAYGGSASYGSPSGAGRSSTPLDIPRHPQLSTAGADVMMD